MKKILGLLLAILCVTNAAALYMAGTPQERAARVKMAQRRLAQNALTQKIESLKPGEYFVHEEETANGIIVTRDILEKSRTLKDMLQNIGSADWKKENAMIPLPFPIASIKKVFDTLSSQEQLNQLKDSVREMSLNELIDTVNTIFPLCDYLNLPVYEGICSDEIINRIENIVRNIGKIFYEYGYYGQQPLQIISSSEFETLKKSPNVILKKAPFSNSIYDEHLKINGKTYIAYPECEAFGRLNINIGTIIKNKFIKYLEYLNKSDDPHHDELYATRKIGDKFYAIGKLNDEFYATGKIYEQ